MYHNLVDLYPFMNEEMFKDFILLLVLLPFYSAKPIRLSNGRRGHYGEQFVV